MHDSLRQTALYPNALDRLVAGLTYKEGWRFRLLANYDRGQGSHGLTLVINITGPDSYHPEKLISVSHLMPVPPAAYDARSWRRWLLDQIALVELHERCEFFAIDGEKPYAPSHGPGNDPYLIREVGTVEDVETSFRGVRNSGTG